jgi:hypothetical protein
MDATQNAIEWLYILTAMVGVFGVAAFALGIYEWVLRYRTRDLLPPPGGRARIYRADPPSVSRWGSTR